MALDNSQTPEKQLLHMIEHPAGVRGAARSPKSRMSGLWPLGFLRRHPAGDLSHRPATGFTVRTANALLLACIVFFIVYLGLSSFVSFNEIERKLRIQNQGQDAYAGTTQTADPFQKKDLQFYLAKVEARDIFQMGLRKKNGQAGDNLPGPSSKLVEATKELRLVGISWSDNPDVMIEDTGRSVTYFLKQSEVMENGVRVRDVFKDRIVLELEGETIELQ